MFRDRRTGRGHAITKFHLAIFSSSNLTPSIRSPSQSQSLNRPGTFDMVKNSNKRAERRAPEPGLQLDYEPSSSTTSTTASPYKPFQHSQQPQSQPKKRSAGASMGRAARAKKAKAIERADKTNQKFVVNKAKAEKKKLMKS
ncbi:zinc finger containing protein [Pseudozyma hubeiensis SY62]|uniref:Zinc finger containing protein n=1 Tax=Pseudozyma hubeiensis (strain SY62) TaxID=1305764 RepID=R9PIZ9_PSEHS|nr:zinc finger containing protein [Pseudozyma hubeiensis SY62]GAC98105.1 zinc finger containing protein [Pseudozyma hubeiensis SY62]